MQDEHMAQEQLLAANAAARRILSEHLQHYLQANGKQATFEGWIALLHPENVQVDPRLLSPESEYQQMWRAATEHGMRKSRSRVYHPGLVEATGGVAFVGAMAGSAVVFTAVHGGLRGGVEALEAVRSVTPVPPVNAILRLVQGSLEVADLCTLGAEEVALRTLAVAGGATCGLLALSGTAGRATHKRLRTTQNVAVVEPGQVGFASAGHGVQSVWARPRLHPSLF